MPKFSQASLAQRATLHHDLQRILDLAITRIDFVIVEGHRGEAAQNKAWAIGASKLQWPNGNHNKFPSTAADCAPYPIDWSDKQRALERFVFMQGVFYSCACELGIKVRLGIDWNRNNDMRDEIGLHDYPHIELYLV